MFGGFCRVAFKLLLLFSRSSSVVLIPPSISSATPFAWNIISSTEMTRKVGLLLIAAVIAAGAGSTGAQARPSSGIRGKVLYGPTCPVEQVGQSCTRPYDARLRIRRQSSGKVVARVRSGRDGRFSVRLRPGHYVVDPVSGDPYPRASSQPAVVHAHRFTHVTVTFDSGIR
jgi:hypothetical protein